MALAILLLLWLPGRIVGFLGADMLVAFAAVTDLAFLGLLFWYVVRALVVRRSSRHASFAAWLGAFWIVELGIRIAWLTGATDIAARLLHTALMIFLVFFSLAVARINVVVINLALDASGETTPYRPHPGRQNLTAGLVAVYAAAALLAPGSAVPAYLALATAAAFCDRLAEWFIGTAVLRTQVLALAAANAFGGLGFLVIGLAGLNVPISSTAGLHLLSIGSLGLAVLSVMVIAGLRHTGRPLALPWQAHGAILLIACAAVFRVLPDLLRSESVVLMYLLSALFWASAYGLWLSGYFSLLRHPLPADATDRTST
jgi:uncharacterized protein involved in response to NO